jgi:hypothetical protein
MDSFWVISQLGVLHELPPPLSSHIIFRLRRFSFQYSTAVGGFPFGTARPPQSAPNFYFLILLSTRKGRALTGAIFRDGARTKDEGRKTLF